MILTSIRLINELKEIGVTPQARIKQLRRLFEVKDISRALEVHSGLSGLIAEKIKVKSEKGIREFDAMWLSSLTDSISKGKTRYPHGLSRLFTIFFGHSLEKLPIQS